MVLATPALPEPILAPALSGWVGESPGQVDGWERSWGSRWAEEPVREGGARVGVGSGCVGLPRRGGDEPQCVCGGVGAGGKSQVGMEWGVEISGSLMDFSKVMRLHSNLLSS